MEYLRDDLDSSRSSEESDFLEMRESPPRRINPRGTNSLTSTAGGQASTPVQPMADDTEKSKWKPLVGTPSKGPIPENILVPDPSTPRTVSDTDSPAQLASSTPRSFIHNRRQGEHTSRPPAFPLPHTPMRAASIPPRRIGDDTDVRPYSLAHVDGQASPNFDNAGTGSPRPQRPPRPSASQIPAFSDLATGHPDYHRKLDRVAIEWGRNPPMVNAMRNDDPLARFDGDVVQQRNQSENDPPTYHASASSAKYQPGPSGSSVHAIPGPSQLSNTLRGVEKVQKGSQPPHHVVEEPPRTARTEEVSTSKPTRANSTESADHHQRDSETSGAESDHPEPSSNPFGSSISNVSNTGARPYAHIETPVLDHPNATGEMDAYLDLRCKPISAGNPDWDNCIRVGSQIAFVGLTRWSNESGEGVYDVGIPYGTQCYVARIFNDHWALCLKLERGLELYDGDQPHRLFDRLRRPRASKVVCHGGTPSIAIKNHPVVAIYAPLCAFTTAANYGPFEERREAVGNRTIGLSTWEGGMVQAANRGSSSLFEDEAKRAWKLYVPLQAWNRYKSFCSLSQQTTDALDENIASENAPPGGAHVSQDPSGRNKENVSAGRQLQLFMSKTGTVRAIKNTANRVKGVFKPEPVVVNVPSSRIDTPRGTPHPVYGNPSGLEPERSNVIPPIATQLPLSPFDDGLSQSSNPLSAISPNILLSSPHLPLLETSDNSDAAPQSGNLQSEIVNTVQSPLGVSSGGGPIQGDPHPGVEVVPINSVPMSYEYRIFPVEDPPERQGDVIVPVINPPERPDAGEAYMRTGPASASLPSRLKKAIQGKVGKAALEGSVGNLATLLRRHFAARADESQPQEGGLRRRNTVQNSITNAWNSIQSSRRRHSIMPPAIVPQGIVPQDTVPQDIVPQDVVFQDMVSQDILSQDMVPQDILSQDMVPQAIEPQAITYQETTPQETTPQEIMPQGADESDQLETSGEWDYTNQETVSLPIEMLIDLQRVEPPNPAPNPRSLPAPGGLRAHLRNVAPHSWVRHRLRSTESNRFSI